MLINYDNCIRFGEGKGLVIINVIRVSILIKRLLIFLIKHIKYNPFFLVALFCKYFIYVIALIILLCYLFSNFFYSFSHGIVLLKFISFSTFIYLCLFSIKTSLNISFYMPEKNKQIKVFHNVFNTTGFCI